MTAEDVTDAMVRAVNAMMLTTTLDRIREHNPCAHGWHKLLAGLGKTKADDELLPYADILRINGLEDALWCCRAEPKYSKEWRLYAVWCARRVRHLMTDSRSVAALDVSERYAHGQATGADLVAARDAARVAARVAARDATWDAAGVAARVATWDAAWDAARVAAGVAARVAAGVAARVATWDAARDAAWDAAGAAARAAAWAAAWDAARAAQHQEFLHVVTQTEVRV